MKILLNNNVVIIEQHVAHVSILVTVIIFTFGKRKKLGRSLLPAKKIRITFQSLLLAFGCVKTFRILLKCATESSH